MRHTPAFLLAACLLLGSCQSPTGKEPAAKTQAPAPAPALPESKLGKQPTENLMSLLRAYYELKDALVAADASKADAAASRVLSAAETMRYNGGTPIGEAGVNASLETIMKQSEAVMNVKDETVELKRAPFEKISDALYGLMKTAGLKHGSVYRQYCPMAFKDKGAYWLSAEEEIRNPYFGKKMLECGEVRDSL